MSTGITTANLLWRDRAVLLASAGFVTALGWSVMLMGHGGPASAMDRMMRVHVHPAGPAGFLASFAMWMAMMVGMMLPAVLPWILLFAAGSRSRDPSAEPYLPTSLFVLGYLAIWAIYSLGAATAQRVLQQRGLLDPFGLEVLAPIGGIVLLAAGLFQLTPFKAACLKHCRSPLGFLLAHWQDGPRGAFRLGLRHGAYCLACCWALMAVGFAVGVMNLIWMAVLTVALCVEKIAPGGRIWSRLFGLLLIGWGAWRLVASLLLVLAATLPAGAFAAEATSVEEIPGLTAWYRIDGLHEKLRNGESVRAWDDASGNGHGLTDDETGLDAIFVVDQVGGKPVVQVQKANTFSVAAPFALDDHTIFLVYSALCERCALFQSKDERAQASGLILREKHRQDQYKHRTQIVNYNTEIELGSEFSITMLGRDSGFLRSAINGSDVSTMSYFEEPIGVGRFFHVSQSTSSSSDGSGLRIAEMMFYDRFLADEERELVTRYLSDKYEIGLTGTAAGAPPRPPKESAVGARLSTKTALNMNDPAALAIAWQIQEKLESPFRHDKEKDNTQLFCTSDGTRVRLLISLPFISLVRGPDLQVYVLKNGAEYHARSARSGPMAGSEKPYTATVLFDATVEMNDGDFIEIVAIAAGPEGAVKLDPGLARLVAEVVK